MGKHTDVSLGALTTQRAVLVALLNDIEDKITAKLENFQRTLEPLLKDWFAMECKSFTMGIAVEIRANDPNLSADMRSRSILVTYPKARVYSKVAHSHGEVEKGPAAYNAIQNMIASYRREIAAETVAA